MNKNQVRKGELFGYWFTSLLEKLKPLWADFPWMNRVIVFITLGTFSYVTLFAWWKWLRPGSPWITQWYVYIIVGLFGISLVLLLGSPTSPIQRLSKQQFLYGILLTFIISRLFSVIYINNTIQDDFSILNNLAIRLASGRPFAVPPQDWPLFMYPWGYSIALGSVYTIFGNALLVGKLFNLFLGALTIWVLYQLGKLILDEYIARSISVLFFIWPSQWLMTNLIAAENMGTLLLLAAFWMFCSGMNRRSQKITTNNDLENISSLKFNFLSAPFLFITGIILGAAYLTRFPLLIGLIACLIVLLIILRFGRYFLRDGIILILGFAITYIVFMLIMNTVYHLQIPSRSIAQSLEIGVNIPSAGSWNRDDGEKFISFTTIDEANQWAMQTALERIRERPLGVLRLMVRKAAEFWRLEDYGVFWVVDRGLPSDLISSHLQSFYDIANVFQYLILLFSCFGSLWLMTSRGFNPLLNLILLSLIGSTLLHAILEEQTRYHYPYETALFFLASIGLIKLSNFIMDRGQILSDKLLV